MGDKIESKKAAAKAKVSTVPGHLGEIADAKQAVKIAAEIGYPVMIKASAGGGGKGMRIAYNAKEAEEGFALGALGGQVELRRRPRVHREVHREPAPHRDPGARRQARQRRPPRRARVLDPAPQPEGRSRRRPRRCSTPRRARPWASRPSRWRRAVGYDSAGTVEFVAGQDRSFYFLEMNTRLQVEHPVTELVTGIDLVEQMIRVAAGEKLEAQAGRREARRLGGREPHLRRGPRTATSCPRSAGWCATGRPQEGVAPGGTVRNDTGVFEGAEISMHYDPMIAKLVTHARHARGRHRPAGRRARRLRHRRGRAQHPVPRRPHAAPALARGSALDRLHRRGVQGRLQAARRPRATSCSCWRPSPSPSTTSATRAGAASPSRWAGRRCASPAGASPRSATTRVPAQVEGTLGGPDQGHLPRRPGQAARRARACSRTGGRASRCGPAWWTAGRCRCRCGPILNGYDLAHRGIRARAYVYTEREAALAALMPEKAAARHLQAAALPDAGPGEGDPRGGRARRSRPARRCAWSKP